MAGLAFTVDPHLSEEMNLIEQTVRRMEALGAGPATGPPSDTTARRPDLLIVDSESKRVPPSHTARGDGEPKRGVIIDIAALQEAGTLVPLDARTAASEEFRHIKRPVVKAATAADGDSRQSLVVVTSAMPGEGKTFFSLNLAMSLAAEVDTSVLLVDADVLRPSVLKSLGLSADRGLLDLLTDENLHLDDVVLSTNVPKLQILGAGSPRSVMSELLASARMESLMTRLQSKRRIVVLDGPPLLVTNEARVLAANAGQVIFVVDAESTPQKAVARALDSLQACPVVHVVLNRSHPCNGTYGYGYGYY
jgi:protein-tyrosine kinase